MFLQRFEAKILELDLPPELEKEIDQAFGQPSREQRTWHMQAYDRGKRSESGRHRAGDQFACGDPPRDRCYSTGRQSRQGHSGLSITHGSRPPRAEEKMKIHASDLAE
jgi:hypothetical protein